jgi:hypothetical protein
MSDRSAYGPYPLTREASGTAWQPDESRHDGIHFQAGRWSIMGHGLFNLVYDWQGGPRGDEMAFVSGMAMASARRDFSGGGVLQFRAMLSPDPLMGKSGYPLLLASGETANGREPLIDRQHPHDLFMELSASYSVRLSSRSSAFLYGGLPGAPAFGPPAFMHRMSIMDSPEAPITHHWLDSTHIVFGVVTAGLVLGDVKLEASRFHGREPDQFRYNIETGPLDSTAVRVSWNPTSTLSLQASFADQKSPEQLEPEEDQTKWSASGMYTKSLGENSWWSTTLAWGRRSSGDDQLDAFALESALKRGAWTFFARAEHTENNELLSGHHDDDDDHHGDALSPLDAGEEDGDIHGPAFKVAKASFGGVYDVRVGRNLKLGVGGLYAFNFVPGALEAEYGGDRQGAMAFLRLKIGG